jgi:hypothetical protein
MVIAACGIDAFFLMACSIWDIGLGGKRVRRHGSPWRWNTKPCGLNNRKVDRSDQRK